MASASAILLIGFMVVAIGVTWWFYEHYLVPRGFGALRCGRWYDMRRLDMKRGTNHVLDGWRHPLRAEVDVEEVRNTLHTSVDELQTGVEVCHRQSPQLKIVTVAGSELIRAMRKKASVSKAAAAGVYGDLMNGHRDNKVTTVWREEAIARGLADEPILNMNNT